jgi:hypothetical protein
MNIPDLIQKKSAAESPGTKGDKRQSLQPGISAAYV